MPPLDSSSPKINRIAPYASITYSTAIGFAWGGIAGSVFSFSVAALDEFLINSQITNKHYASTTSLYFNVGFLPWANIVGQMLPSWAIAFKIASVGLAAGFSYLTDDFLDFNNKLDVPIDAFITLNANFDSKQILSVKEAKKIVTTLYEDPKEGFALIKKDLSEIYQNDFLRNFVSACFFRVIKTSIVPIKLYFLGNYGNNLFITILQNNHPRYSIIMAIEAGKVIGTLAVSLAVDMYLLKQLNSLANKQHQILVNKASSLLLDDNNSRKLLGKDKEKGQEILNNIFHDMYLLAAGSNKLSGVLEEITTITIAINCISTISPTAILPYILFSQVPSQYFLKVLSLILKNNAKELSSSYTKAGNLIGDIIEKSEAIVMRDGQEFIKSKFNIEWNNIQRIDTQNDYTKQLRDNLGAGIGIFHLIVDASYFYFASVDINRIPLILKSKDTIVSFLSSNINSQMENVEILLSKERVDSLLAIINTKDESAEHLPSPNQNIIVSNYTLFLSGQEIVRIDSLILEKGKHYAITGKAGCGKSSFLIDIKKGVVGVLSSYGQIYIPENAKIMLLDQDLYIPKDSSLLEVIYFPSLLGRLSESKIKQMKWFVSTLFRELQIDEFVHDSNATAGLTYNLDTQNFKFSGGQKQKISIIQAVLNEPDFIIIDESFARMDTESVLEFQKVIKKYLGQATLLVVDHKAEHHNYNNFYDANLHFENHVVAELSIANIARPDIETYFWGDITEDFCPFTN